MPWDDNDPDLEPHRDPPLEEVDGAGMTLLELEADIQSRTSLWKSLVPFRGWCKSSGMKKSSASCEWNGFAEVAASWTLKDEFGVL